MLRSVSVVFLAAGPLLAQPPPRYVIHDLGPLKNGAVTGINIHGQVIGYETLTDGRVRAFRTAPNTAINWTTDDLGTLGGTVTRPRGINAHGQVTGESALSNSDLRAFRTSANRPINPATDNLGTLGGSWSHGRAINDSGQVTGESETGESSHAFLTSPTNAINPATDDLDMKVGQFRTVSRGDFINNRAHVLGTIIGYPLYPTSLFRTERSGSRTLGFTRYYWQDFRGLTEQDQIVFSDGEALELWQDGRKTVLSNCDSLCVPVGINNSLQVVGATQKFPFLYAGGVIYDLRTLIPDGSGWALPDTAYGPTSLFINDLGQITGLATLSKETHAFRMDPVPSVTSAIEKAHTLLVAVYSNPGRRSTLHTMMRLALAAKLNYALASWNQGNTAATRGFLNEFETLVRTQVAQSLTAEQANQLIDMAEAAYALT